MGLTFEQETLASILAEQRRTNELLEELLDTLSPPAEAEPTAAPEREKLRCRCKMTFTRPSGSADPCPHCGFQLPASKTA